MVDSGYSTTPAKSASCVAGPDEVVPACDVGWEGGNPYLKQPATLFTGAQLLGRFAPTTVRARVTDPAVL